jgi:C1A family cysteine protease
MKVLIVAAVLACSLAVAVAGTVTQEFVQYMQEHGKKYADDKEFQHRFAAFRQTKSRIARLNAEAAAQGLNTRYAINKFSDMTTAEFKTKYMGYKPSNTEVNQPIFTSPLAVDAIPTSYDWRSKNMVTPVKNQEQCGSCWAFSTTEGVESAWLMAGKPMVKLAPQQIVDCDQNDDGCDGGDLPTAFAYVIQNGLEPSADYPYTAEDGNCAYDKAKVAARIKSWAYATKNGNETQMQLASLVHGPLSICVDAETWQDYQSGVVTHGCGDSLDHCVQIVGWNTSSDKIPYWIIRNSWGTDWGLNGYIWVIRNKDECGVSDEATYALAA